MAVPQSATVSVPASRSGLNRLDRSSENFHPEGFVEEEAIRQIAEDAGRLSQRGVGAANAQHEFTANEDWTRNDQLEGALDESLLDSLVAGDLI